MQTVSLHTALARMVGIGKVITEKKMMCFSLNPHILNVCICGQTCFFYSVAWSRLSELMMLKALLSISRVTTAQLVMRNLLCSLSTEDSSLECLPTSILITPLTEIRKSLFLTLPYSFSLCPVAFSSHCCSSWAVSAPLHT